MEQNPDKPVISEGTARSILQAARVERNMKDRRTAAEIVTALGLARSEEETSIRPPEPSNTNTVSLRPASSRRMNMF